MTTEVTELVCKCGYEFDLDEISDLITYHGDEGPRALDCPECEATLLVTEIVRRTYDVAYAAGKRQVKR